MTLYLNKQNDTIPPTIEKYGEPIPATNSITLKTKAKDEKFRNRKISLLHKYRWNKLYRI